jgi:AraC-like DNA-binding protein
MVRRIESASPRRELREYVRAYGQREIAGSYAEILQPVPASLEQILEFDFYNSPVIHYPDGKIEPAHPVAVVGPHTYPAANICFAGRVETFVIFFQPLALWQIFRIPTSEVVNRSYDGCQLLGNGIRELWYRMAENALFETRVRLVEEFLMERAASAFGRNSIMSAAMYLFQHGGKSRIGELASHTAKSVRQFERDFSDQIGLTPKLFARITRFQMALDAKINSPGHSWLYIAHEFGYFDQMHMVRDFQKLCGHSPSRTLIELVDTRPEALAAS